MRAGPHQRIHDLPVIPFARLSFEGYSVLEAGELLANE